MTIFDIMPSLWLVSAVLFSLFSLFYNSTLSLCALSASLFAFAFSLLSLPIYLQCFSFIMICFSLFILSFFTRKINRDKKHIFCAVSTIDTSGGFAKHHGKIFSVYSRDEYIRYRCGEVFKGKKSNTTYILWGKHT